MKPVKKATHEQLLALGLILEKTRRMSALHDAGLRDPGLDGLTYAQALTSLRHIATYAQAADPKLAPKPPRKRLPPAGACECDRPTGAHSVRNMAVCEICGVPGFRLLITIQNRARVHPRCVFYDMPLREARYQLAWALNLEPTRFKLCCLGDYAKDIIDLAAKLKRGEDVPELHA
jgi:hypothetical protein